MIQNWVVLTAAQKTALEAFNNENAILGARAIDAPYPGDGLNTNPDAAGFASGAPVPLTGMWVVPKYMIISPDYTVYAPDIVAGLLDKPWCMLESETIFAPEPPLPGWG